MVNAPARRRRTWSIVATETRRFYWAAGLGYLVSLPVSASLLFVYEDVLASARAAVSLLVAYPLFLLLYVALTLLAYGKDLGAASAGDPPRPRGRWWAASGLQPGAPMAGTFAGIAMLAAISLALTRRDDAGLPVTGVLTAMLVLAAWATMVVSYAADYARRQPVSAELSFPGEQPADFADFLYFSLVVSTTFGTTDVTVTTRSMRRVVSSHALVAFVFNTVIIALLVSTLLA